MERKSTVYLDCIYYIISDDEYFELQNNSLAHWSVMYCLRTDSDDDAFCSSCGRGFPGGISVLADRW